MERIHDMYRPKEERMQDFLEVEKILSKEEVEGQASRCYNCGIPFCHGAGCPLENRVPDFNQALALGELELGYDILSKTSFFPEFTSRVCPALCESSCVQNIENKPVMVRQCEKVLIENAFENGLVKPFIPSERNGKRATVVGSGPSGLYAAEALNRKGYTVTVYEANHRPGGLLRYGIPDFKLNKELIERRVKIMEEEGIRFICDTKVGVDVSSEYVKRNADVLILAIGTPSARDLKIPGRELKGVHFALEFLQGQNRVNGGELSEVPVSAKGKKVLVIGGGDTGSDCVGTAIRQGCKSVMQIEIMPEPPSERSPSTPWPEWAYMLRTSSSHKEGCERRFNLSSLKFLGEDTVKGVEVCSVKWEFSDKGRPLKFAPIENSNEIIEADLVLLAMGFTGVPEEGIVNDLGLSLTPRTAIISDEERKIFAVGDAASGASLVVRAMASSKNLVKKL